MAGIYRDETHPDLVWMQFDGPTWDDFERLLNELKTFTQEADSEFYLVFYPTIDMPRGTPLPHIRRIVQFINESPKIKHMLTILPKNMAIARTFANLATKVFPTDMMGASLLPDVEAVHETYQKLKGAESV